jgi:hypothetical protein
MASEQRRNKVEYQVAEFSPNSTEIRSIGNEFFSSPDRIVEVNTSFQSENARSECAIWDCEFKAENSCDRNVKADGCSARSNGEHGSLELDHRWLEKEGLYDGSTFRLFVEVGKGFESGHTSCRQISEWLWKREVAKTLPKGIPTSGPSISRCCRDMEVLFGKRLDLDGAACLFIRNLRGMAWKGFTPLGRQAWLEVKRFLGADEKAL